MVTATKTRDRKGLVGKQPLVPFADDGPLARAALAQIHNEMRSYGGEPAGLDKADKERPRWTRLLREARYQDYKNNLV